MTINGMRFSDGYKEEWYKKYVRRLMNKGLTESAAIRNFEESFADGTIDFNADPEQAVDDELEENE